MAAKKRKPAKAKSKTTRKPAAKKKAGLPHLDHLEKRPLAKVLTAFLAEDSGEPTPLAVSRDFYEMMEEDDAYEQQDKIFAAYAAFFDRALAEFTSTLGKPAWSGSAEDDGYPDWVTGERVAVWERDGKSFFLTIDHSDKELPVLVELRWRED